MCYEDIAREAGSSAGHEEGRHARKHPPAFNRTETSVPPHTNTAYARANTQHRPHTQASTHTQAPEPPGPGPPRPVHNPPASRHTRPWWRRSNPHRHHPRCRRTDGAARASSGHITGGSRGRAFRRSGRIACERREVIGRDRPSRRNCLARMTCHKRGSGVTCRAITRQRVVDMSRIAFSRNSRRGRPIECCI